MSETKSGSISIQWHGKKAYSNSGATYIAPATNGPYLYSTLDYSVTRDSTTSSQVTVKITGNIWRLCGSSYLSSKDPQTGVYGPNYSTVSWRSAYQYEINVGAIVNGESKRLANKPNGASGSFTSSYNVTISSGYIKNGGWTGTFSDGEQSWTFDWAKSDSIPLTFYVSAGCYSNDKCASGNFSKVIANMDVPTYTSETPASKATDGVVHTTNNTSNANQSSISEYPDQQIWFNWSGQSDGTPEKNHIHHANIDINTTKSSDDAHSIEGLTDYYTANTKISLMSIVTNKGVKIGSTLYFYVNLCTNNGDWLGHQYLGSVTLKKNGYIYYKDSSGTKHECTSAYYKNSSGTKQKARYVLIKDSSGTKRTIDVYTTLYE